MSEPQEFRRAYHREMGRDALKKLVFAAEAEAVIALGGPVVRKSRFLKGDEKGESDVEFIWRLATP